MIFNNSLSSENVIFFVRHGETDWNTYPDNRFQGRKDIPLNAAGLKQAKAIGELLKNQTIQHIYSSPLNRALETAKIISAHHSLPVKSLDELKEMDFGDWEGKKSQDIQKNFNNLWQLWKYNPEIVNIPDSEKVEQLFTRTKKIIELLCGINDGSIIVVTHGAFLRALTVDLLNMDKRFLNQIKQDNGSVNCFTLEKKPKLKLYNYTEHLT